MTFGQHASTIEHDRHAPGTAACPTISNVASRITLDLSDEEFEALHEAAREGRFASVEDGLRAGIHRVARSAAERRDVAAAYRAAYERFPQDPELGEMGADLLADIVEAESPKS